MPVDALVLVPGLGLGPEAWRPTVAALGDTPHSFVVPLEAYGLPAGRTADLRPAALADRLVEQLPSEGQLMLVGHSASCQVVIHAARQAPGRVAALILVGPTTDPRAQGWPRLAARWLATARHERPGQVPILVRQYRRTTLRTMARGMDAARRERVERLLIGLSCPVLVVRGHHDRICPADWAQSLGDTVTLAAGAHMVPLTHGDLVAREVARFAASRVGGWPGRSSSPFRHPEPGVPRTHERTEEHPRRRQGPLRLGHGRRARDPLPAVLPPDAGPGQRY